jgi:hypothetical protein
VCVALSSPLDWCKAQLEQREFSRSQDEKLNVRSFEDLIHHWTRVVFLRIYPFRPMISQLFTPILALNSDPGDLSCLGLYHLEMFDHPTNLNFLTFLLVLTYSVPPSKTKPTHFSALSHSLRHNPFSLR